MRIYTGMLVTTMASIPLTYCDSFCVSISAEYQKFITAVYARDSGFEVRS